MTPISNICRFARLTECPLIENQGKNVSLMINRHLPSPLPKGSHLLAFQYPTNSLEESLDNYAGLDPVKEKWRCG